MHALYDELAARMIHDHHIPEGMTAELLTDISQYVVKSSLGPFCSSQEVLQVGFGHFLAELQYLFTSIANKERQQSLFIYSAHDSTIASLLCACGILLEKWPRVASVLSFEVFVDSETQSEYLIRLLYNNDPMNILALGKGEELVAL